MKFFASLFLCVFSILAVSAQVVYTDNQWLANCIGFAADNNKVIPDPTAFRVNTTDKALIVEIKLEGTHWKQLQLKKFKTAQVEWPAEESVELFLDPGRSCSKYVQLACGVNGGMFDSRFVKKAWAAKWTVQRTDFKGGVILKFTIPYDNDLKKPETGDVWGFNVCRNVKAVSTYYSTFAKVGTVFNTPSKFAELRFGTEKTFTAANQAKKFEAVRICGKRDQSFGIQQTFCSPHCTAEKTLR